MKYPIITPLRLAGSGGSQVALRELEVKLLTPTLIGGLEGAGDDAHNKNNCFLHLYFEEIIHVYLLPMLLQRGVWNEGQCAQLLQQQWKRRCRMDGGSLPKYDQQVM